MSDKKHLRLGVLVTSAGIHAGGWRHPSTRTNQLLDFALYRDFAKLTEKGKLDTILLVELHSLTERNGQLAEDFPIPVPDVLTILSAMASVTERIGLTGTYSTTYNDAYHLAHKFATLDHLSEGRAGWNMVTSQDPIAPYHHSMEGLVDPHLRYERASEFIDLVKKYWDSWDENAILADKHSGLYLDPKKIRSVKHDGRYYPSAGTPHFPRPIQGHPVLFQAGSSESGLNLAAEHGEVVFTAQDNLPGAKTFYRQLKGKLSRFGRRPDDMVILPGIAPILGSTEREAKKLEQELNELVIPEIAVKRLSALVGIDLSTYPIDGPVPLAEINPESSNTARSRIQLLKDLADREHLSIRQLSLHAINGSGHFPFVGTPEQLADFMQEWQDEGACDGFNILISHLVAGLEILVDHAVPILQKRGLRPSDYAGTTLRENLGLTTPAYRQS
ncbi:LLM class flavin-dependent oxidoreductase [Paenibacillus periandrae]|uniref:LLM class flavin-dependent oxidoreductase n=1 Tax=Paenibacillus periandrae TaxID=1761741 RepID=UPI001F0973D9|nr:LLM class flavin-dependent oxidoreductase [Paenibacillus periandrae]